MSREKTFHFKQFSLLNDKTAMKVGTDGVLLGAWCDVDGVKSVLDVGTGCGLIALMVAQRNKECFIECLDIDADSVDEAKINIAKSPWPERITASVADFKRFSEFRFYDLIVSNPPFFDNGILSPDKSRRNARHSIELSISDLISHAIPMLSDQGRLCLITPTDAEDDIITSCKKGRVFVNRKVSVYTKAGGAKKRYLWEIRKQSSHIVLSDLYIQDMNGKYSKEYVDLCKDFYIHM